MPCWFTYSLFTVMGKAKKKTKGAVIQEVQNPIRKSNRATRPSMRLRDQDVNLPSGSETEASSHDQGPNVNHAQGSRDQEWKDQLKSAQDQIHQMQQQILTLTRASKNPPAQPDDQAFQELDMAPRSNFEDPEPVPGTSQPIQIPPTATDNETQVHNILTEALSQMVNSTDVKEGESDFSQFLILGATLDQKTKSKIWAREYIELSSLNDRPDPSVSVSVQNDGKPSISLKPTKTTPPSSYYQWLKLFSTYAAVYLQKYPEQAAGILTYMMYIFDLFRRHPGYLWRTYDVEFRKVRAFVDAPWHKPSWDLLLRTNHSVPDTNPIFNRNQPFRRNQNQNFRKQNTSFQRSDAYRTPKGFCFSFDKQGVCRNPTNPCPFRHECTKCWKRGHSRVRCYSRGQQPREQVREPVGENQPVNKQPNQPLTKKP